MSYDNVEKLTAVVFRPCNNFTIKHIVQVSKKSMDGKRQYFHKEFTYISNKYSDKKYLKSINLDFYSYLLIEEQGKDWTNRETIMLHNVNLPNFKNSLREVVGWFTDSKYDDLYYIEHNELKLNAEFADVKLKVRVGENKSVLFRPTVIEDHNGTKYEGIEMFVNTNHTVGYITLDNLIAMCDIITSFNLYQSSLELINYLQRPDWDQFNHDMADEGYEKHSHGEKSFTQVAKRNNTGELKEEIKNKLGGFFNSI